MERIHISKQSNAPQFTPLRCTWNNKVFYVSEPPCTVLHFFLPVETQCPAMSTHLFLSVWLQGFRWNFTDKAGTVSQSDTLQAEISYKSVKHTWTNFHVKQACHSKIYFFMIKMWHFGNDPPDAPHCGRRQFPPRPDQSSHSALGQ